MAGTIALLREQYQGVEAYLCSCGLTQSHVEMVRIKLQEPLTAQL
jgi:hypothetical protein